MESTPVPPTLAARISTPSATQHSTNSHGAEQTLMACERQYIDAPLLHINGQYSCRLAGIHDKSDVCLSTDFPYGF